MKQTFVIRKMHSTTSENSSFRDPSGLIFYRDNKVYRQINNTYQRQYDHLMSSGLYSILKTKGMLVAHEEVDEEPFIQPCYKVISPEVIPFISYPYEWSFGQIKDCALLTLKTHRIALDYGMILKDASAYNIQFILGNPVCIDTLSFDFYEEGYPWVAYGQFCRHFLAPLFLMAYRDIRLSQLLRIYIDGIPIDLASILLGKKGGFAATQHIRWHARATMHYADAGNDLNAQSKMIKLSKVQHIAMIDSLIRIVDSIKLKKVQTEWGDYNRFTSYTEAGAKSKATVVKSMISRVSPPKTWDFGANDGTYSKMALINETAHVVAFDIDPIAVERNYNANKQVGKNILPLILDLTNPSPDIGFANNERLSVFRRSKPDLIIMLAVIHHMAISNNLPLIKIANWLSSLSNFIIVEFVPKEDAQVKKLLQTRTDIFPEYTQAGFEKAFSTCFDLLESQHIEESQRAIYLFQRRANLE